jgi:hypothetical protein
MAKRTVEPATDRTKLLAALRFASLPAEKEGASTYVTVSKGYMIGQNDTFSVGTPIDVAMEDVCPQHELFKAALTACKDNFTLTQQNPTAIQISSGGFKAVVPTMLKLDANWIDPDPLAGILPDIRPAFRMLAAIPEPRKNDRVHNNSLLLRPNSLVGTNGSLLVEYWHGTDLPQACPVPLPSAVAIGKFPSKLCGFGWTNFSLTFWFEDGTFLKTRLMSDVYPSIDRVLQHAADPIRSVPIWKEFDAAMVAIEKFVTEDTLFFHPDLVATSGDPERGASYKVPGLPGGHKFTASYWRVMLEWVERVSLGAGVPSLFLGGNFRGVMAGRV